MVFCQITGEACPIPGILTCHVKSCSCHFIGTGLSGPFPCPLIPLNRGQFCPATGCQDQQEIKQEKNMIWLNDRLNFIISNYAQQMNMLSFNIPSIPFIYKQVIDAVKIKFYLLLYCLFVNSLNNSICNYSNGDYSVIKVKYIFCYQI